MHAHQAGNVRNDDLKLFAHWANYFSDRQGIEPYSAQVFPRKTFSLDDLNAQTRAL